MTGQGDPGEGEEREGGEKEKLSGTFSLPFFPVLVGGGLEVCNVLPLGWVVYSTP